MVSQKTPRDVNELRQELKLQRIEAKTLARRITQRDKEIRRQQEQIRKAMLAGAIKHPPVPVAQKAPKRHRFKTTPRFFKPSAQVPCPCAKRGSCLKKFLSSNLYCVKASKENVSKAFKQLKGKTRGRIKR